MGDGEIEIESITPIDFPDITPELARESGFLGVLDLLKVAMAASSRRTRQREPGATSAAQPPTPCAQGRAEIAL
jgi:hypothetical protein